MKGKAMINVASLDEHRPTKSPKFFADKIRQALGKSIAGFVEAGRWLETAKNDESVKHGQWLPMLQSIPIGHNTAHRLMIIAQHEVISNMAHAPHLPPSWYTLYELTKLPTLLLEAKIEDGTINPNTERKDVLALREGSDATPSKRKPRSPSKPKADPAEDDMGGPTDNVNTAIDAFVAAIANESDKHKVQIMLTICDRAKIFPLYISEAFQKRSKERGEVETIFFGADQPRQPKKRS